jgi:dihydroneopterin aldolase
VAKRLFSFVGESEFQLVETLAERVCDILLNEFDIPWCRLQLNKQGALRGVRDVGIIIERGEKN